MLNLHATFTKGTIEFRLFQFADPADGKRNGLHAGEMKAYIQLCLAMSQLAKMVRTASPKPQQTDNEKYAMRCWMLSWDSSGMNLQRQGRFFCGTWRATHPAEQISQDARAPFGRETALEVVEGGAGL